MKQVTLKLKQFDPARRREFEAHWQRIQDAESGMMERAKKFWESFVHPQEANQPTGGIILTDTGVQKIVTTTLTHAIRTGALKLDE